MPGTIQISVLELRNLPSPLSPDSVSIRVVMGKREYRIAVDKGEFSIPLTTLRENMLVKVFDANGIEICWTGIKTKTVIEKGSWNDTFPLEGGGEILLKLLFILSEEERNRIRVMRVSALKKDGELVGKSPLLPENARAPSLGYVDGSGIEERKKVGFMNKGAISQEGAAISRTDELTIPNQDTTLESIDGGEDPRLSPLSVDATARLSETSSRKPAKISNPEPMSSSAPHELKESVRDMLGPPEKTPSSIRTMISVFESGLAQESLASSKTFDGNDKTSTKSLEDDSISGESARHIGLETEGDVSDPQREESQLLSCGEIEERFGPATIPNDDSDSSPSTTETATAPGSDGSDIWKEKSRARITYSLDEMGWGDFYRDEEMPGIWIFPDYTRSICITTGGKHAVCLMECCVETITASMTEHLEEGTMLIKTGREAKEDKKAMHEANLSRSVGRPSGLVMRIAVMVGFGVLVLFTRQKKNW